MVSCGEDFCGYCGDCLACYGDDPCMDEGTHEWPEEEGDDSTDAEPTSTE